MESACRKEDPEWGPYLSNRQWGTVREDTSQDGNAWECISYEEACSKVYRWGEDGLFGYSDRDCQLCMCLGLWNGEDHILKERLFGLTGPQGNHGEDIKELLYYLDGTPDHTYMKALYKYPYSYPYTQLVEENKKRGRGDPEFEIMDTGIFDRNEYFDVQVEYVSSDEKKLYCCYTLSNQGNEEKELWLIPQFWFRKCQEYLVNQEQKTNTVRFTSGSYFRFASDTEQHANCIELGRKGTFNIHFSSSENMEILFTRNEDYNTSVHCQYMEEVDTDILSKDGFHSYIIDGDPTAVTRGFQLQSNNQQWLDKCGVLYKVTLPPNGKKKIYWAIVDRKLTKEDVQSKWETVINEGRHKATSNRYGTHKLLKGIVDVSWKEEIFRQAYAGLLWSKQFYQYNVRMSSLQGMTKNDQATVKPLIHKALNKEPGEDGNWQRTDRNKEWKNLNCHDIISMPDKWEFPWFASWDLAFQMIPYARVDPDFAERQMLLFLSSRYMHPSGQIPGCEWGMDAVFPPVHAWGCLSIHHIRLAAGTDNSLTFLLPCFEALRKNFDWWMNAMKFKGSHIFSGGFLGMDNISVVDRSHVLSKGYPMQQADATGWMAMFALNMVEMAMCICKHKPVYGKYTIMYLNHFLSIAESLNTSINNGGLWDPHDKFYYDVCLTLTKRVPIRVRSLVGIVPLFAGVEIKDVDLEHCRRLSLFLKQRQSSKFIEKRGDGYHLSAVPKDRIGHLVRVLSDQEEFLSQYGVRSLSKVYKEDPYILHLDKELRESLCVKGDKLELFFNPGESETWMFGGNSNWRGPVWLCMNYMMVLALNRWHRFSDLSNEIVSRIISLFKIDETTGLRPCHGSNNKYKEEGWRDLVLFHEFFDGDTGRGCGASHQTGWTALIIEFLLMD